MTKSNPADYVLIGLLRAIYAISPTESTSHSLSHETIYDVFLKQYSISLDDDEIHYLIKMMESAQILSVIVDPYADSLLETSDKKILDFAEETNISVIGRGWSNDNWLRSALKNQQLWSDFKDAIAGVEAVELVPSADGFVTINHNSASYIDAENSLVAADDALRGDNEFQDSEQKTWIRVHLESGLALLKKGGPVLRSALLALIVEPLKAAMKATANENVKKLIGLALTAFLKWLGM